MHKLTCPQRNNLYASCVCAAIEQREHTEALQEYNQHQRTMQTPEANAGRLTELVMARVRGKLPELPTHEYNRVYECVLGELNCHVLGETHEIPEASARRSNAELCHRDEPVDASKTQQR